MHRSKRRCAAKYAALNAGRAGIDEELERGGRHEVQIAGRHPAMAKRHRAHAARDGGHGRSSQPQRCESGRFRLHEAQAGLAQAQIGLG